MLFQCRGQVVEMQDRENLDATTGKLTTALLNTWSFNTGTREVDYLSKIIDEVGDHAKPIATKEVAESFLEYDK